VQISDPVSRYLIEWPMSAAWWRHQATPTETHVSDSAMSRWTCRKIWGAVSCGMYRPGEWLWIYSNGKMETRHPVEGSFGNEFSSMCNCCRVMAAWSRKNFQFFCVFWKKTYSVPKGFIATPIDVLSSNFVKYGRREIGKVVRYLPDKNENSARSLLRGSRTNLPGPAPDNVLRVLQISPKSVHFRRSYTRTREDRQNRPYKVKSIFGWSLGSSQIITI